MRKVKRIVRTRAPKVEPQRCITIDCAIAILEQARVRLGGHCCLEIQGGEVVGDLAIRQEVGHKCVEIRARKAAPTLVRQGRGKL